MDNQSNLRYQAGEATGQAQVKKEEMMEKARETKDQAGGYIQQTGEQIKSMAQNAAETVKNAVGMGDGNTTTHSTTNTKL